jgi:hypothetical protein
LQCSDHGVAVESNASLSGCVQREPPSAQGI